MRRDKIGKAKVTTILLSILISISFIPLIIFNLEEYTCTGKQCRKCIVKITKARDSGAICAEVFMVLNIIFQII